MHISDGILPAPFWIGGYLVGGTACGLAVRRLDQRRIPQVAVMASLFFVASSVRVPVGPGTLHLLLNGLMGVVLGWTAVPAIFLSLLLQALLLFHGGLTTLGVNTVTMASGAVAAHYLFRCRKLLDPRLGERGRRAVEAAMGLLAGAVGVAVTAVAYLGVLVLGNPPTRVAAEINVAVHLPLVVVEAFITAAAVAFLSRVKPELLQPGGAGPGGGPGGRVGPGEGTR